MVTRQSHSPPPPWEGLFAGAVGLWLALALIKFGNPIIFDDVILRPANLDELLLFPWPVDWAYVVLGLVCVVGWKFWRWPGSTPGWLLVVPLIWLGWQGLAAFRTVDAALSTVALKHFSSCLLAYFLGLCAFSQVNRRSGFWMGLIGGFVVVLAVGARQHFGGLEETRQFFFSRTDWASFPDRYLAKLMSDRIYATLFYPNALAGVILLLLPISLTAIWRMERQVPANLKLAGVGFIGALGLGCLYWSGSKAGWLIALGQAVVFLGHVPGKKLAKVILIALLLTGGLAAFAIKYQAYLTKGGTSLVARFDYWTAAWQTLNRHPWFGSGPGTFKVSYSQLKPQGAEMARLAHNDFLQQGSDSGWIGLLSYAAWIAGALIVLYDRRWMARWEIPAGLWLGLGGVALQSCVEFGLYIPAISWPMLFLLGWALALSQTRSPASESQLFYTAPSPRQTH